MPLIELPGFAEARARHQYQGNRLPVLYEGPRHCRRCSMGLLVRLGPFTQHALFIDGGYGASETIEVDVCLACGATAVPTKNTVRPPKRGTQ